MEELKKLKQKKWLEKVFLMWFITIFIGVVGLLAQWLLPTLFKKDEYMEMLMNQKDNITVIVIAFLICIALAIFAQSKSTLVQAYVEKIYQKKFVRVLITTLSIVFCTMLSLIIVTSVISQFVTAKSVETMNGKVDSIITTTSKTNGDVDKMIVIKDSDGKKHHFYKSHRLDDIDVNNKDNIEVDYVKTLKGGKKNIEGDILGYTSYNKKPQS